MTQDYGQLPFALQQVSITYQIRQLAGVATERSVGGGVIGCLAIGGVWALLGALRLRRGEHGSAER